MVYGKLFIVYPQLTLPRHLEFYLQLSEELCDKPCTYLEKAFRQRNCLSDINFKSAVILGPGDTESKTVFCLLTGLALSFPSLLQSVLCTTTKVSLLKSTNQVPSLLKTLNGFLSQSKSPSFFFFYILFK